MLENEFFPTPSIVISKMLGEYRLNRYQRILEPSGGSGAILDYIANRSEKYRMFTCEINPDLVYTLQGKGYRLIERDFLRLEDPLGFDFIAMNPPFSNAVKHVLHAWDLLSDGGDMVALINAETYHNQYSKERQLLGRVIADYGSIEFIGQAFKNSERPTDVEIAIIRLSKPAKETPDYFTEFNFSRDGAVSDEDFAANPLAHGDIIKAIVSQYNMARELTIQRSKLQKQLDFFLNDIADIVYNEHDNYYGKNKEKADQAFTPATSLQEQLEILKSRFWNTIFTRTKLESLTTSDFRKKFTTFAVSQSSMAFTEDNVKELLALFFENRRQIMVDCLVAVFDEATRFHEKNAVHTEGWKTNKGWKINKRIIHPYGINYDKWGFWNRNYRLDDFLMDIDKSLCWLSGKKLETITPARAAIQTHLDSIRKGTPYDAVFSSTFFKMRIFKKGTIHLDFIDLELLDKFNQVAAEGKNWIGGKGF